MPPPLPQLPIDAVLPELQQRLANGSAVVLQAPPGAGKTTRVPLALLDQPWLGTGRILLLEPRRLAARAAAVQMAALLGEQLGETVGYRIRFESCLSERTRIEVITEGILTRRLQSDPDLAGVRVVIFDEFHERSLHSDLGLALCREVQELRADLKLLVMSATLDGAAVAKLLGDAPIVNSQGRQHPVAVHYSSTDTALGDLVPAVVAAIDNALALSPGDVLVFLPGEGEIRRLQSALGQRRDIVVHPLYGNLPVGDQQRALQPDPHSQRKVVLATAIAETSLTIAGVTAVVDSGYGRCARFLPSLGMTRMVTERISRDSADQRAGRAGRLGPGLCLRLWRQESHAQLRPHRPPELLSADLAPLALELAQWGVADPTTLAWLDPPPPAPLAQARELLRQLGALDRQGRLTAAGRALAALPLHPRLGHMLLQGAELGLAALACDIAALLEERDLLNQQEVGADLTLRLATLARFRRHPQGVSGAERGLLQRVERAAQQWRRALPPHLAAPASDWPVERAVGLLLAFAYPDRIAAPRPQTPHRFRLSSGRGAQLRADDPLALGLKEEEWLVAAHLDAGEREGRIFLAAAVRRADLRQHLSHAIESRERVVWSTEEGAVIARREERLGELVIASQPLANSSPDAITAAMLVGIRALGVAALPWSPELRQWQQRLLCLQAWCPEAEWPEISDAWLTEQLQEWLAPYLAGITRQEQLKGLKLAEILAQRLSWQQQQRLEALAPERLTVPSGSRLRLRYQVGEPPVLAVKLQELFGLSQTPRVADGRVAVMLHLLSPAQRPIQVTQDLESFWRNTYPEVKKELKGRYPKHPWPDDPHQATPTRRTKAALARDT